MSTAVLVLGSLNMDIVAYAPHLPRMGETLLGHHVEHLPGGKGGNQVVAAARAGAVTKLIACTGEDQFGDELWKFVRQNGVDVSAVKSVHGAMTGQAFVTIGARGETAVVVIPGANALMEPDAIEQLEFNRGDVAVCQLEVPIDTVKAFLERANRSSATTILNCAPMLQLDTSIFTTVDVNVVNEVELLQLTGITAQDSLALQEASAAVHTIARKCRRGAIATLGERGVVAEIDGEPLFVPARRVPALDTAGAGDCFVGCVAARLAIGAGMLESINWANVAASLSVQRRGAAPSMPFEYEVEDQLRLTEHP